MRACGGYILGLVWPSKGLERTSWSVGLEEVLTSIILLVRRMYVFLSLWLTCLPGINIIAAAVALVRSRGSSLRGPGGLLFLLELLEYVLQINGNLTLLVASSWLLLLQATFSPLIWLLLLVVVHDLCTRVAYLGRDLLVESPWQVHGSWNWQLLLLLSFEEWLLLDGLRYTRLLVLHHRHHSCESWKGVA